MNKPLVRSPPCGQNQSNPDPWTDNVSSQWGPPGIGPMGGGGGPGGMNMGGPPIWPMGIPPPVGSMANLGPPPGAPMTSIVGPPPASTLPMPPIPPGPPPPPGTEWAPPPQPIQQLQQSNPLTTNGNPEMIESLKKQIQECQVSNIV